eukprot:5857500-Prymnesium_polylepis.1
MAAHVNHGVTETADALAVSITPCVDGSFNIRTSQEGGSGRAGHLREQDARLREYLRASVRVPGGSCGARTTFHVP